MQLKPADLGDDLALQIIQARTGEANPVGQKNGTKPGAFSRWATRGSGLEGETQMRAAHALMPTMRAVTAVTVFVSLLASPIAIVILQSGSSLGAVAIGALLPATYWFFAWYLTTLHRVWYVAPVSVEEITTITDTMKSSSMQYEILRLAREMMRHDHVAPEAAQGLRDALRLLGNAAEHLPPVSYPASSPDALRDAAEAARAQSNAETDPVTKASLLRRADALEQSVASAERAALVAKRTDALRGELMAQIESLRLGLSAYQVGDAGAAKLAALSENVRTVAAEAVSVASAREELDAVSMPLVARR